MMLQKPREKSSWLTRTNTPFTYNLLNKWLKLKESKYRTIYSTYLILSAAAFPAKSCRRNRRNQLGVIRLIDCVFNYLIAIDIVVLNKQTTHSSLKEEKTLDNSYDETIIN